MKQTKKQRDGKTRNALMTFFSFPHCLFNIFFISKSFLPDMKKKKMKKKNCKWIISIIFQPRTMGPYKSLIPEYSWSVSYTVNWDAIRVGPEVPVSAA